jgi:hypothetical protein
VTLDVIPAGAGKIHISTIEPTEYPWQGVYYNGIPIQVTAIANEGYAFLNWGNNEVIEDVLNPVFLGILNVTDIAFEAYFEDLATSTPELKAPPACTLFPNPANDVLYLKTSNPLDKGVIYKVIDINGRTVLEGNLPGNETENQIAINAIAPGLYLLKLHDSGTDFAHLRFVKL